MAQSAVEVEIRDVSIPALPLHGSYAARVVLGRRSYPAERALSLQVGFAEAHALQHELRGNETMRSQTIRLLGEVTTALGGRVMAARLVKQAPHILTATIDVATPQKTIELPTEPGQALALAVRLGIPLLADPAVFSSASESAAPPLSPVISNFLQTLDLGE